MRKCVCGEMLVHMIYTGTQDGLDFIMKYHKCVKCQKVDRTSFYISFKEEEK